MISDKNFSPKKCVKPLMITSFQYTFPKQYLPASPSGWDSWDSWDGWDGWDSWDQLINRQLETQSG